MDIFRKSREHKLEKANSQLLLGIKEKDIDKVSKALEDGANVNAKATNLLDSLLPSRSEGYGFLDVVGARHTPNMRDIEIAQLLLEHGVEVNTKDGFECTALMHAVGKSSLTLVASILEHNPDVDARDWNGNTALFYAIRRGDAEMVALLLINGADIEVADKDGHDWRHFAKDPQVISIMENYSCMKESRRQEKSIDRGEVVSDIIKAIEEDILKE